jgi:hypothetical protein
LGQRLVRACAECSTGELRPSVRLRALRAAVVRRDKPAWNKEWKSPTSKG